MAEAFTLIGWLLNIGTFYGGYVLGKKQEKEQYRRELIEKYYPPLIENLRSSALNTVKYFTDAYIPVDSKCFSVLVEMKTDDTLRIIESIDKEVYDNILIIADKLLPSLKEIQERRQKSFKTMHEKWNHWLRENESSLPRFKDVISRFADNAQNSLIWPMWRKDSALLTQNLQEISQRYFWTDNDTPEVRDRILEAFRTIASREWEPIISDFKSLNKQLIELIEEEILPRMSDTIYGLGK